MLLGAIAPSSVRQRSPYSLTWRSPFQYLWINLKARFEKGFSYFQLNRLPFWDEHHFVSLYFRKCLTSHEFF